MYFPEPSCETSTEIVPAGTGGNPFTGCPYAVVTWPSAEIRKFPDRVSAWDPSGIWTLKNPAPPDAKSSGLPVGERGPWEKSVVTEAATLP